MLGVASRRVVIEYSEDHFCDRLTVSTNVAPPAHNCSISRFGLRPFDENAMFDSIAMIPGFDEVEISGGGAGRTVDCRDPQLKTAFCAKRGLGRERLRAGLTERQIPPSVALEQIRLNIDSASQPARCCLLDRHSCEGSPPRDSHPQYWTIHRKVLLLSVGSAIITSYERSFQVSPLLMRFAEWGMFCLPSPHRANAQTIRIKTGDI